MKPTYAIGDIHGRDSLLEKMYERIIHDPFRENHEEAPTVIHIGDYIDGGPESDKVLDRVIRGRSEFESVALLGNHEALMLECLETDERDTWWNWISKRIFKSTRINSRKIHSQPIFYPLYPLFPLLPLLPLCFLRSLCSLCSLQNRRLRKIPPRR